MLKSWKIFFSEEKKFVKENENILECSEIFVLQNETFKTYLFNTHVSKPPRYYGIRYYGIYEKVSPPSLSSTIRPSNRSISLLPTIGKRSFITRNRLSMGAPKVSSKTGNLELKLDITYYPEVHERQWNPLVNGCKIM